MNACKGSVAVGGHMILGEALKYRSLKHPSDV